MMRTLAAALVAAAVLGACATQAEPVETGSTTSTTASSGAPEQDPVAEKTEDPVANDAAADDQSGVAGAGETFTMPNLVGMNLQDAQDELQSLGSYILSQDDATGRGRFLVLDSNWKVCAQDQAPGETLDLAELVNLTAVKLEESCP